MGQVFEIATIVEWCGFPRDDRQSTSEIPYEVNMSNSSRKLERLLGVDSRSMKGRWR
jgi:hypothetical protein